MPRAATAEKPQKRAIADRKTIADHVCEWMHDNCRALSIDTLLTRPLDAMQMGLVVAAKSGRIPPGIARKVGKLLDELAENPDAMEAIDEVCRAALSSRKRGDLKRDRY